MAGIAGTHEHRDRSGSHSRPTAGPFGACAVRVRIRVGCSRREFGERHRGAIATSRPHENSSPPADATPLLHSTKAVDGMIFSLDYRNLIRVRRVFSPRSYTHNNDGSGVFVDAKYQTACVTNASLIAAGVGVASRKAQYQHEQRE